MLRVLFNPRFLALPVLVFVLVLSAPSAVEGASGILRGKVLDLQGKPVEGAMVVLEFKEGVSRKFETKSNQKGEFSQVGLQAGFYQVVAEKPGIGKQMAVVRVTGGRTVETTLVLGALGPGGPDPEKVEALKKAFNEGVAMSEAGKYDEAIAKFQEALLVTERCYDCWYNIGIANSQKKDYAQAEVAFKKTLELKADYAEAYNGLANIYNAQKRFDEAAQASAEAGRLASTIGGAPGGSVESVYNQGVIAWNAGKIAEAKKLFEEALQLNPEHAGSHYWLGMANLNEGKLAEALAEMEAYLKRAPDGEYAAQAKGLIAQLKK